MIHSPFDPHNPFSQLPEFMNDQSSVRGIMRDVEVYSRNTTNSYHSIEARPKNPE
jgi:hypothetical protein